MFNFFNWFSKPQENAETYSQDNLGQQIDDAVQVISVSEISAINHVNVFACVRAIAETMSSLPFPVYSRLPNGGKQRLRDHGAYQILNVTSDGEIDSMQWREALAAHALTWGNGYSEIEFSRGGDPLKTHLIPPNKVEPERTKTGEIKYKVEGSEVRIPSWKMIHVSGMGFDGVKGYSPIKIGKEAIRLSISTELFGNSWFDNGSRGQGVIKHPETLSADTQAKLRKQIEKVHRGPRNSHKWIILEEGMNMESLGTPPEDAQFLGTRLFQLQEICRLYRISPVVVQDLSRSTFSNNEQEMISFVVHTLRPWCRRIENQINRKLFRESERNQLFAEHVIDGLLRGDRATRDASYAVGRQWGWYSADDVLELENRNPLPDRQGTTYLVPQNMIDAASFLKKAEAPQEEPNEEPQDEAPQEEPTQEPNNTDEEATDNTEAVQASLDCVRDNIDRMLRREVESIRKASRKPSEFLNLMDAFYQNHHHMVFRAVMPSLTALNAVTGQTYSIHDLTAQIVDTGQNQLLELSGTVEADDLPEAIEQWAGRRLQQSNEILVQLAT